MAWAARLTAMPARLWSQLWPASSTRTPARREADAARIAPSRPGGTVQQAEEAGLVFAFRARCLAILIVALSIVVIVPWPRNLYYLAFAVGFFLLGFVPFRLRRHRHAEVIKLGFVVLDVCLITAAVLNFPSGGVSIDWPMQTRLRNQNFLFMLLLLGEAALTYSPRRVIWTGASIAVVWSLGFLMLYELPNSKRYGDMASLRSDADLLDLFLNPTYVSLPQWLTQLVATTILTALVATAVHRSRMHLLARVQAEVLRSDLARYVSPDVADALCIKRPPTLGRRQPATWQSSSLTSSVSLRSMSNSHPSGRSLFSGAFRREAPELYSAIRARSTNILGTASWPRSAPSGKKAMPRRVPSPARSSCTPRSSGGMSSERPEKLSGYR